MTQRRKTGRRTSATPQPRFPFEVRAFIGEDGVPVVEVDTASALVRRLHHRRDTGPVLRVWVNDALVHDSPPDR